MILALTITHVVVSLALVIIVLLQQGKQQGLSGAIAGAGETFFGKSKARTIDAMLKKFTTVVAALFIINSVGLYIVISNANRTDTNIVMPDFDFPQDFETEPQMIGFVDEAGNVWGENLEGEMEIMEGFFVNEDGFIVGVDEEGETFVIDWATVDENGEIWVDMPVMPDMIPYDPETGDFDLEGVEGMLQEMFGDGVVVE